ncbi:hypothetical protein Q8A67_008983 [Cirrhinus molitorella]|uniref:Uncharacterized protein n=1 Tax=Cirrhinus molitorella TaxID=172907 RepID=A0AA88PYF2_9TELE|nr:hypothetical protein Q8A67_008983 [Cirrhinus molitorella]
MALVLFPKFQSENPNAESCYHQPHSNHSADVTRDVKRLCVCYPYPLLDSNWTEFLCKVVSHLCHCYWEVLSKRAAGQAHVYQLSEEGQFSGN